MKNRNAFHTCISELIFIARTIGVTCYASGGLQTYNFQIMEYLCIFRVRCVLTWFVPSSHTHIQLSARIRFSLRGRQNWIGEWRKGANRRSTMLSWMTFYSSSLTLHWNIQWKQCAFWILLVDTQINNRSNDKKKNRSTESKMVKVYFFFCSSFKEIDCPENKSDKMSKRWRRTAKIANIFLEKDNSFFLFFPPSTANSIALLMLQRKKRHFNYMQMLLTKPFIIHLKNINYF